MSFSLRYRPFVLVEDLFIGECTIHRAGDGSGARWWLLWMRVVREDTGAAIDLAVAVNPNGNFNPAGPGGKTWGLRQSATDPASWLVEPSVNALELIEIHPGEHPTGERSIWHQNVVVERSIWHQNVVVEGVPADEVWITGAP